MVGLILLLKLYNFVISVLIILMFCLCMSNSYDLGLKEMQTNIL